MVTSEILFIATGSWLVGWLCHLLFDILWWCGDMPDYFLIEKAELIGLCPEHLDKKRAEILLAVMQRKHTEKTALEAIAGSISKGFNALDKFTQKK